MPPTNEGVLLVIGAIFFLIGLLGGGFEISALRIPSVGKYPRLITGGIGIIFMGIALSRFILPPVSPQPTIAQTISVTPTMIAVAPAEKPIPPTDTPKPTDIPQPSTPMPTKRADELNVYDSFDDNCINTNLWSELSAWNAPTPVPAQSDHCWNFEAYGFEERDGRLYITCSNPKPEDNRSYSLFASIEREFSDVELDLTVLSAKKGFGAMGLLFNLEKIWSYYMLWYGGARDIEKGYVVLETGERSGDNQVLPEPNQAYSLPATVKLRLSWDGTKSHFYVDGREVMTEPAQAYGRVLAVACGMGWNVDNSDYTVKGYVDEVRIRYH